MHWGINPPSKTPPPLSCQVPPLNLQTVQAPFLSNPPSILVFHEPSRKVGFFSEPQKYWSFSPLTQSYILKVTKFLVEISQFEFLIITEKNIFAHKLFCHYLRFWFIFIWKLHPLNKVTPLFPSKTTSKSWGPVMEQPLFENLVGGSTPFPSERGGCTLWLFNNFECMFITAYLVFFLKLRTL